MTMKLFMVFLCCIVATNSLGQREQCSIMSRAYMSLGFPALDVPRRARSGRDLQICSGQEHSCCTEDMEQNLNEKSDVQFSRQLANATQFTRTTFITATAQFNEFFLDLLRSGQAELDAMFSLAYGLQYKQNKELFDRMFDQFKEYYRGGDISLNDVMNKFFKDTFLRMFALQNPQYDLDDAYLQCVGSKMDGLKPFGDIPQTLTKNIRQAFVAARTFVQGLAVGRNVILKMAEVQPTLQCIKAFTKQSTCAMCQGLTTLKPCQEYCVNVMKGCMAYHAELQTSWSNYIDTIEGLADRLESAGSFNIEVVITPFKDLISEAIMEYHVGSSSISENVFKPEMCGQPPRAGRRNKRSSRYRSRPGDKSLAAKKGTLYGLVSGIKSKIAEITNIWTDLPDLMCGGRVTASKGSSRCWNGEREGRYTKKTMGNGLAINSHNPEVHVSMGTPNEIVTEQIRELDKASRHLSNAKLGIDVDWLDFDVTQLPVSNSGSVSGSKVVRVSDKSTTTEKPQGDFEIKEISMSGSGDLELSMVDMEDGDDEEDGADVVLAGSGWKSDLVQIAPPGKKPGKLNSGRKGRKDKNSIKSEGSGTIMNYDEDKPVAIAILPSGSGGDKYTESINYNSMEGSGRLTYSENYDDEDRYPPRKPVGNVRRPVEPNIIQAGSTEHKTATRETTPKSTANVTKYSITLIITSCVLLIGYLSPGWIT